MARLNLAFLIGISFLLASCTPLMPGNSISTPPIAGTASIGTIEPERFTPLPPGFTPPPVPTSTPHPTLSGGLGLAELKYKVLAEFPDFFFCDPDFYPIASEDELELAWQRFPEIQSNSDEYEAILVHNDLAGVSNFTEEQKLLIYREHKKLAALWFEPAGDNFRFKIQLAETEGEGELITGLIDEQGSITVVERTASIATCPICLAAGTLIDTPVGPLPVESLQPGMPVWTQSAEGKRIAQPLDQIGKTTVPIVHRIIHLVLEDEREVWISPGHPTAEGITAGQLLVGKPLNGSIVLSADRVVYTGLATYDLLPAGDTGYYWANGILLASTLNH